MILSYNVSLYGLVFFISVSVFFQPHDVTFFGLTVMIPEPHATLQVAVTWRNQCHDRATL